MYSLNITSTLKSYISNYLETRANPVLRPAIHEKLD